MIIINSFYLRIEFQLHIPLLTIQLNPRLQFNQVLQKRAVPYFVNEVRELQNPILELRLNHLDHPNFLVVRIILVVDLLHLLLVHFVLRVDHLRHSDMED